MWWCNPNAKFCIDVIYSQSQGIYPWTGYVILDQSAFAWHKLLAVASDN